MELQMRVLYMILSTASLLYIFIKYTLNYWKRRGILHPKPALLWGNVKGVIKGKEHVQDVLQRIYDNYHDRAPFVGVYACLKPFVLVLDLQLVKHILVDHAGYFTTRGLYHNMQEEPLSGNLLQLDGHKWRELHSKSVEIFTTTNVEKLLPRLLEVAKKIVPVEGGCNVSQLIDGYNSDAIASLAFGQAEASTDFRQMLASYWGKFNLFKAYMALEFPLVARMLLYKSYNKSSTMFFKSLVVEQLSQPHERLETSILELYKKAKQPLNLDEIAAQAFAFILAGLTPLNSTLSFCLYELALHPEIQQRVRHEIQVILIDCNKQLTWWNLQDLKYTKQVIKETLRLHTPHPLLLRRATKFFELPNSVFAISRGNNLIVPVAAIHRDPNLYSDPLRFDPDRFEEKAVRERPPMAFLPYGDGLRGCVAMQLAEMQLLVGLVALLQHYSYAPCKETAIPMLYDNSKLLLKPKSDIWLSVKREDND